MRQSTKVDPKIRSGGVNEAEPSDASSRRSRWGAGRTIHYVLLSVLLLAGAAGQIRVWASDRGLWNDELHIADNLKYRGVTKLAGPLLYAQTAPPGWLAVEKSILNVLGPDEQVPSFSCSWSLVSRRWWSAAVHYGRR